VRRLSDGTALGLDPMRAAGSLALGVYVARSLADTFAAEIAA
jgi:hypothetical protein